MTLLASGLTRIAIRVTRIASGVTRITIRVTRRRSAEEQGLTRTRLVG